MELVGEPRTDTWRAAMVRAVVARAGRTTLDGRGFTIAPAGLTGTEPFSFIVIGDTGEGDASQQVLRDSLLRAATRTTCGSWSCPPTSSIRPAR